MNKDIIKFIRQKYNMTQREFAKTVECSFALIALIEVGKRRVTDNLEAKVKDAFNLNDEQLSSIATMVEQLRHGLPPM
ncbi:helix-turn-helix transcriptional regulator [Bacillus sp. Marseille-P3661]|uniref:helix-turn-helix transcriptional regulator n=1 Tax=Bacillus sp. Marseille-P3661 TaxID=1936234 RepID=UPI000C836DD4|nr:helix-turn-helix transcriptional regulator [Bacillus sp. Marseille-P3661]